MENKELAIRILNFVMPYIPEHIKEEAMDIIKESYTKKMENEITIKATMAQADRILEALKYRAANTCGFCHEDSIETYNIVKHQIENQ